MQDRTPNPAALANFEELALIHMDSLYGTAWHLTRNSADAQDLVQDTYLRAFEHFDKFQSGTNFRAWIFAILRNTFINHYHKSKKLPCVDLESVAPLLGTSETAAIDARIDINGTAVSAAIASLPVGHRMMLVLAYTEGLSYREIAEVMNCPIGTVMSRLHRARKHVRAALERKPRRHPQATPPAAVGDGPDLQQVA